MLEVLHKRTVYMDERHLVPCIEAVQGDSCTRTVELTMLCDGEAWTAPDSATVCVAYRKSDGTAGLYDRLPDGTGASTWYEGALRVTLAPQVLTAAGEVRLAVIFSDPDTLAQLAAFPLTVQVMPNPAAGEVLSNDYYNYSTLAQINNALEQLEASAPLRVTVSGDGDGGYIPDVYTEDIRDAYENGRLCVCLWEGAELPLTLASDGDYTFSAIVEGMEWRVRIYGQEEVEAVQEPAGANSRFKVYVAADEDGNYVADCYAGTVFEALKAGKECWCQYREYLLPLTRYGAGAWFTAAYNEELIEVRITNDSDGYATVVRRPLTQSERYKLTVSIAEDGTLGTDCGYSDICEALEAGKDCWCQYGEYLLPLTRYDATAGQLWFTAQVYQKEIRVVFTAAADTEDEKVEAATNAWVELDATLTESGKAADAKAVGAALDGIEDELSDLRQAIEQGGTGGDGVGITEITITEV